MLLESMPLEVICSTATAREASVSVSALRSARLEVGGNVECLEGQAKLSARIDDLCDALVKEVGKSSILFLPRFCFLFCWVFVYKNGTFSLIVENFSSFVVFLTTSCFPRDVYNYKVLFCYFLFSSSEFGAETTQF